MKTRTSVTLVGLLLAGSALAVVVAPFGSWDILTKKSEDIVIARCTATAEPLFVIDGIISSEIHLLMQGPKRTGLLRDAVGLCAAPRGPVSDVRELA